MSNTVNNYTETDLGNISLNPRGEYDNSAAYEYLDTVSYQGGSYFCLAELETTITGIAPDSGRNSEHWQMIAAPGDMTPEYTAAYNDVIKKAVQVETSRAAVELTQQEIEAVQTDVQQLHSDTVQAAQEAENSKNSAANSAQSAEQSRNAASESEQNVNAQIAGFDSRVSEAVEQSKEEINTAKQQAIDTITNQQNTSVNAVKTEGEKIITRVGNDTKIVADDRATVEEAAQTVLNNAQEVAQNTQTVASNTENAAASAESAKTSADNAAQSAKSVDDASKQIEQNKKDVASLKEDITTKITKFYASNQGETHLVDSDDGKIMDMMVYGKSSQNKTTGKNLLKIKDTTKTVRGVTVTSKDGIITVNGTATETGWTYINIDTQILTDGTYIVNYEAKNNDSKLLLADTQGKKVIEQNVATTLSNAEIDKVCFVITKGETYNMTNVKVQLELGSSATSYEPYTGGIPSPNPDYPQEIKSVVNPTVKVSNEDGTKFKTVTLPYTLNAIPVSSGGNVTIDGQQYIADYVDVERGKLVRRVGIKKGFNSAIKDTSGKLFRLDIRDYKGQGDVPLLICDKYTVKKLIEARDSSYAITAYGLEIFVRNETVENEIVDKDTTIFYAKKTEEINLTPEKIAAFKALTTYYPVTNISVNSEQLDGYTVFNYPVSMKNGWNYVKQQLNDNRDYIYDMDLQSAEAYVNSEYAVALTELEV